MGNDVGIGGYGYYDDYSLSSMRRGWAPVSQAAQGRLDDGKEKVRDFIVGLSFDNVLKYHIDYEPTNQEKKQFKLSAKKIRDIQNIEVSNEIIQFHIVSKLRPRLNEYCKKLGCTMKWRKLSDEEKRKTKYKHQKRTVYYGVLHINRHSREKLHQQEASCFSHFDMLAEACLFSKFRLMGVPACDAIGWIKDVNVSNNNNNISNAERINKLPFAKDIGKYIDQECGSNPKLRMTCVTTLASYQNSYSQYKLTQRKQTKKTKSKQTRLGNNSNSNDIGVLQDNKNVSNVAKSAKTKTKSKTKSKKTDNKKTPRSRNKDIRSLMSGNKEKSSNSSILGRRERSSSLDDDDEEYMPPSNKRRRKRA